MSEVGNDVGGSPVLPASHAFVVQFRIADGTAMADAGRVEHLVSGAARAFGSWLELREFVERVLASRGS